MNILGMMFSSEVINIFIINLDVDEINHIDGIHHVDIIHHICKVELATLNQIETKTRPQVQLISYSRKSTSNLNKISIILIHNEE